jgi:hypothetical protein
MRNLLDKASAAQNLDGNRLTGSLHFPKTQTKPMPTDTQEPTANRLSRRQFLQTHGVTFSIRYRPTASSAANAKPTLTEGDACQTNEGADQRNCLWNSRSGAFSLSLVKTISKYPLESAVHAEASTATTALHMRSRVGGIMVENSTSLIVKSGRQRFSPMACLTLISPMIVARTDAQARFISIVSSAKCWNG